MSFIVETARLGMRPYHPDDAEEFFALCTDPEGRCYMGAETNQKQTNGSGGC